MSSLEKAEIAQDTLAIVLGADPPARPVAPDWRASTFAPNRDAWAGLVGDYQTSDGVLRVYREGDSLLATIFGGSLEFVPQSDTTFIMLSGEFSALDEVAAEFQRQADGTVVCIHGPPVRGQKVEEISHAFSQGLLGATER